MSLTTMNLRIDSKIKQEATEVFEKMGLTSSEAVRLFLYQSVAEKRIPFSLSLPNKDTEKAIKEAIKNKNLEKTSPQALKNDWLKHERNQKNHEV